MDTEAVRIRELVVEACGELERLEAGAPLDEPICALLDHLRDRLCGLADETGDPEARSAACGVVAAIDEALSEAPVESERGAA